jgi:Fe-S-cluster-containing dehydrogenase component
MSLIHNSSFDPGSFTTLAIQKWMRLFLKRLDLDLACVRICPTGALEFGPVTELSQRQAQHAGKRILAALPGLGLNGRQGPD